MLSRFLNQTAVRWANPVKDGFGGYTFDSPAEITCRWEDRRERVEDENGNEVVANSIVYSNRSYSIGDRMYLGSLDDMDSASEPTDSDISGSVKRIIIKATIPSVDASIMLYKYYLK